MPPLAISRSSTYLPKICGNIARRYRSAVSLLPLLFLGCTSPDERVLAIRAHTFAGCPAPQDTSFSLFALGDFDVTNRTVEVVNLSARDQELVVPYATRAVAARVPDASNGWQGVAERRDDTVDFVLWPNSSDCEIVAAEGAGAYPAANGRQALGVSRAEHTVLVAGGAGESSASALSVDLDTGVVTRVAGDAAMRQRHEFASVTAFGDGLVVAGGYDVIEARNADAELFVPARGRFDQARSFALGNARRRHSAVVLENGDTLLVGGFGNADRPLRSLEILSPATGGSFIADLPLLDHGAVEPAVVRLDDGRVLVLGGVDVVNDDSGAPLADVADNVVWLSADAHGVELRGALDLPPLFNRAVAALPGGGALVVGGCENRPAQPNEDCAARCGALPLEAPDSRAGRARGCPPLAAVQSEPRLETCSDPARDSACFAYDYRYDVHWLTADGRALALPDLPAGIDAGRPMLLEASDGAPWLLVPAGALRFDPWTSRFERQALPSGSPTATDLPAPISVDGGAFVWLDELRDSQSGLPRVSLRGFRHGTRSRFESDLALLLDSPSHLAPNQPATLPDGSFGPVYYDGALHLLGSAARAFITDTTYRNFRVELTLEAGPAPALLVGTRSFTWSVDAARPRTLIAQRTGSTLELEGTPVEQLDSERVALGVSGADTSTPTVISRIVVQRSF